MKRFIGLALLAIAALQAHSQTPVIGAWSPVAWKPLTSYSSTSSIAAATIYTAPSAGQFRLCSFVTVSVVGTAGSFTAVFNWTTVTHNFVGGQLGKSIATTSLWDWTGSGNNPPTCQTLWADAATNIQYGITASGVTGTPTIQYAWTLERLQ